MASFNDAQSTAIAEVTTASPLSDATRARLVEKLSNEVGQSVQLHERVVPSLIGGIRIQLGDYLFDGTIAAQLRELESALLSDGKGGRS
jgi:F-type H+-transporting ATPase subunit delta